MGFHSQTMSFGSAMRFGHLAGATAATLSLCYIQHQSTLQSGLQPTTVSEEWAAATVGYHMNRPLESNENKRFIMNPIRNTTADVETGRANKFSTLKHLKNPWEAN